MLSYLCVGPHSHAAAVLCQPCFACQLCTSLLARRRRPFFSRPTAQVPRPQPADWCAAPCTRQSPRLLRSCAEGGADPCPPPAGTIPAGIGTLPALNQLRLQNNQLSGTIPPFTAPLNSANFSTNQLTGTLSTSFGSLTNLYTFVVSANQLTMFTTCDIYTGRINQDCNAMAVLANQWPSLWASYYANGCA